ncbi:MAG: cation transporter [Sphingomonadaceae bacterium]|nr:cation transporter [Sphingomonadaceae bacterium]
MADNCECTGDADRAQRDPGYRRALWLVVALNLSFGVLEVVGGLFARSQALLADSLDFLGDGTITLLGLLALGWAAAARAKVAFAQGLFLLTLGFGIIGVAIWRAMTATAPEADLMGGIGVAALAVNVTAALVLSQYRDGDANVRAVWLFSRNDALANVAVIAAAGLVAWTGEGWPDLAVAAVIAALFLHSAFEILRSAKAELTELRHAA